MSCHQLYADVGLSVLPLQLGLFRCAIKGWVLLLEILICAFRKLFFINFDVHSNFYDFSFRNCPVK